MSLSNSLIVLPCGEKIIGSNWTWIRYVPALAVISHVQDLEVENDLEFRYGVQQDQVAMLRRCAQWE